MRRVGRLVIVVCALVWAIGTAGAAHAQVAGGDIRFGIWGFLHREHERWPEIGGRIRLGRSGARTHLALEGGAAFDFLFGGTFETLGATVLYEPGVVGRRHWYLGLGYTALWVSGGGAAGFAHGASALTGVHLARGAESRWSLEARLLVGPGRERSDGFPEPVRYLSIGLARRFGSLARGTDPPTD